ncbi:MAG: undecaprenyl-diphosphatase UppP [Chloroflexia bacterium]|nr:undecaprenyl-diphosphatase UppP [Chloroflexia bacterium]
MELWQAIVLGFVQGLTEFLPISSSGHLIIFPWLFGWEEPGLAFDAALHLGTLVAVVVYFWRDILGMVRAVPSAARAPWLALRPSSEGLTVRHRDGRLGWLIAIGTLPGLAAGLLFEGAIGGSFHAGSNQTRAILTIATMLIVVGGLMALAERRAAHRRDTDHLTWADALVVGAAQAVALIPGTSRSGATLTAALFRGLRRPDAARFSFLLGMPLILGAGLKSVLDAASAGMTGAEVTTFVAGGLTSALVGFGTIWGLLRFLQRRSTMVFVVYRILFGLLLLTLLALR